MKEIVMGLRWDPRACRGFRVCITHQRRADLWPGPMPRRLQTPFLTNRVAVSLDPDQKRAPWHGIE